MTSLQALAILRHLADPAVRAVIVAAIAAITVQLLRLRRTPLLLGVWTAVLYAAVAMPLLGLLLPTLPLHLPIAKPLLALPADSHVPAAAGAAAPLALDPIASGSVRALAVRGVEASHHSTSWPLLVLAAYTLTTCFFLARLALGLVWGRRLARTARPIHDPAARVVLEVQARALDFERNIRLAQSGAVAVPLTLGVLDPAIILPVDWSGWDDTKLAAVIAHELAHVKRRDALTRLLSGVYRCFFWFSPLSWWLHGYLADLAELASDQEAIAAGTDPACYAEVLMSFFAAISHERGRLRVQAISMAHGTRARRRIESVLSMPAVAPAKLRRPVLVLIATCATSAVILVAAVRPMLANAASPLTADSQSTRIISNRPGMEFAIVSNRSMTVNGSDDDRNEVDSLQRKLHGDFIWFIRNGDSYVIRDAATVRAATQLYEPMEALSRQQQALGEKQEALGKQQEELGRKMEAIEVKIPDDLETQLKRLESTAHALGPTGNQKALADLQDQIGRLQSDIGRAQSNAGRTEALLGRQQGELGRKQGQLGRQQGSLGREQGRLARAASRKMQTILQQALANGLAKRAS